MELSLDLVAQI